jgi:hypothetical protein
MRDLRGRVVLGRWPIIWRGCQKMLCSLKHMFKGTSRFAMNIGQPLPLLIEFVWSTLSYSSRTPTSGNLFLNSHSCPHPKISQKYWQYDKHNKCQKLAQSPPGQKAIFMWGVIGKVRCRKHAHPLIVLYKGCPAVSLLATMPCLASHFIPFVIVRLTLSVNKVRPTWPVMKRMPPCTSFQLLVHAFPWAWKGFPILAWAWNGVPLLACVQWRKSYH